MSKVIKANTIESAVAKIRHWCRSMPNIKKVYCVGLSEEQKVFIQWTFINVEIV